MFMLIEPIKKKIEGELKLKIENAFKLRRLVVSPCSELSVMCTKCCFTCKYIFKCIDKIYSEGKHYDCPYTFQNIETLCVDVVIIVNNIIRNGKDNFSTD